jgi:hypothetical protein
LIFHTPDNHLIAFDSLRQEAVWQLDDVPPVVHSQVIGDAIGLITNTQEMLTVSLGGQLLDRAPSGSIVATADGRLLAYSGTHVEIVSADGQRSVLLDSAPVSGESSALLLAGDGTLYLFNADPQANTSTLYAYDTNHEQRWAVGLPHMPGLTELTDYGSAVLLTGNHGYIIAIQPSSGGVCGLSRIYGNRRANVWHRLDDDGVLRVAVADQILGLDWQTFLGGCV